MSNLPEQTHHTDHQQRSYQANIDKREFEPKELKRHSKGRRHLILIDKLKVDMDVDRAVKGESSYD